MKTQIVLSLTVFAMTATVALADSELRTDARRAGHALTHTGPNDRGAPVRDTIRETVQEGAYRLTHTDRSEPGEDHHVRDSIRNFVHKLKLHRPRAFHYLEMRKSKEGVKIYACEPMIERLANSQECRQIHRKAFNAKALYSCAIGQEDSKFARRIGRNLDKLMRREFDIRRIDDSIPDVDGYTDFLLGCEAKQAARPAARPVPQPRPRPQPQPAPAVVKPEDKPSDFKPIEPSADPVVVEQPDTL